MNAVLVYASFAPFHRSRIVAAAETGDRDGDQLTAIEIAGTQSDYRWAGSDVTGAIRSVLLFPEEDYWSISAHRIGKMLKDRLDSIRPDVVVLPGWNFKESVAGLSWCLRNRVACVLISDSQSIDNPRGPLKELVKSCTVRRFDAAFVGGAPHVRYVGNLGIPPERCVPGCDVVDNGFFEGAPRSSAAQRQPGTGKLFSAIRLLPRKNVLGVLDTLQSTGPRWTWTVAGDGGHRDVITARVKELGLGDRVNLIGHVPYEDLPRHYASADAYLQPSLSEPWGLAVNEAMAAGLPVVVSSKCGCHEDLVRQGVNGYVFDPTARDDLAKVLDSLWADRPRWSQMGDASRAIISDWGLRRFADGFWSACRLALANRRGSLDRFLGLVVAGGLTLRLARTPFGIR